MTVDRTQKGRVLPEVHAAVGLERRFQDRFYFGASLIVAGAAHDLRRLGEHEVHQRVNAPADIVLDHDLPLESIVVTDAPQNQQPLRKPDHLGRRIGRSPKIVGLGQGISVVVPQPLKTRQTDRLVLFDEQLEQRLGNRYRLKRGELEFHDWHLPKVDRSPLGRRHESRAPRRPKYKK